MNRLRVLVSSMVLIFSSSFGASLAYGQITPSADAYTNTVDSKTNYGASTLLDVDGATQTAYIQFNLASIPATYQSADIAQATLKLYVNTVATAGSFNVDYVNGTWSESTISSSLAPALGATIAASVPITTADKNQFILIDVTPAVQAWLGGTTNDGIALVANGTFNATFDSKENGATSHAPELDIVFAGGGLSGVTTSTGSGLTGGGTSGTLNLGLVTTCASGQVLQWSGTAWACATPKGSGTITGVTTASSSGLTGGGTSGKLALSVDSAVVPLLATANTFSANQTVNGTISANSSGNSIVGFSSASGYGVEGSSPAGIGVFGQSLTTAGGAAGIGVAGQSNGTVGAGVSGSNTATTGSAMGVLGSTSSAQGYGVEGVDGASSGGTAGFFQVNSSTATIVQGNNGSTAEFSVDAAGDVTAAGAVSGSSFLIGGTPFAFGSVLNLNAFLGFAGNTTMSGGADTASGYQALHNNTSGQGNTASGYQAMYLNSTGSFNTGTGTRAGSTADDSFLTGQYNTALGFEAFISTGTLNNATAIGALAEVSESNALVLGSINGVNGATASTNVGIGTSAPGHLLDVAGAVAFDSTGLNDGTNFIDLTFGVSAGGSTGEGISSSRTAGPNQFGIDLWTDYARRISIEQHGNVGIGTTTPTNLLTVVKGGGSAIADGWATYSSRRWKTNIQPLHDALARVEQLRGVSYDLKDSGKHEIGVIAEEVGAVVPEVVSFEDNGKDARGVDYSRLTALLIEATKQQQGEIRREQAELAKALRQIKQQQSLLATQASEMRSLKAEVRETRETLRKVKSQVDAAQPALVAAK